jgi:DNA-binding transcriptional ArsR family regulator
MMSRTLGPVFQALGDPTRRWFIEALMDGEVRLREVADMFPLSLPTVLHHLRVLEKCGLLDSRKEGPMRLYSLRAEGLQEAEVWLRRVLWSRYRPTLGSLPEDWGHLRG